MKYNLMLFFLFFLNTISFADDYKEALPRGKMKNFAPLSSLARVNGDNLISNIGPGDIPNNIGQGYYKTTDKITNTNGVEKNSYQMFVSQPQSSGGFSNISSCREFTSSLGVNSSLKSSIYGADLSASASFENNIANTNKTMSFIYQFSKTALLSAKPLNSSFKLTAQASDILRKAIAAQNLGDNEPMRQFESSYGTSFVKSEEIGAKIYVMLTFSYATQYAKQSFSSKLEGKYGLADPTLKRNKCQFNRIPNT